VAADEIERGKAAVPRGGRRQVRAKKGGEVEGRT